MKKVSIIGAGFSGLVTAWYLLKLGWEVEIYERQGEGSGLIGTRQTPCGLIETAANGLLNSYRVEELIRELAYQDEVVRPLRSARRRYIFRNGFRQWPVGIAATVTMIGFMLRFFFSRASIAPLPRETIRQWGVRSLGQEATEQLLEPGLQGIYGGKADELSASLILGRFFKPNIQPKPSFRGTLGFKNGMGGFLSHLRQELEKRGCRFQQKDIQAIEDLQNPVVIATSAQDAAKLLRTTDPRLADRLSQIQVRPILTATLFFAKPPKLKPGFGGLFPRSSPVRALGVLFNSWIFPHRARGAAAHSETWICDGSGLNEASLDVILKDRERVFAINEAPVFSQLTYWPQALPSYSVQLEDLLKGLESPKNVYLVGNYLGQIGLTRILDFAYDLAQTIESKI